MNEEIMNDIQSVRPKDQFTFSCRQCGACCRNIEGCVMVESLDAYRLARYLRTKGESIEGIEDFLFRYCDPEPLTEEGFPIYMLKTKAPNGSCIFLMDGRCSVYPARTRTCRIYPLTVGPGERGRDFEYCLCLDRHRSHFTGSRVSVKDWLYQNFKREDKEYVKREYEIATELGKLMRAIDPAMRQGMAASGGYQQRVPALCSIQIQGGSCRMKNTSQQYLNSEAHGYLMEAKACKLLLKDLERIRAKLRRRIEKEAADREAEFEAAMQYHSENDIQEAYGWEFISEQQYERYLELFRQGRKAIDEHSPTVTELALSILNRIFQDIDRDCRQCEFEALSPDEQLAELKRAEESRQAWRQYIASLKEMVGSTAAQE